MDDRAGAGAADLSGQALRQAIEAAFEGAAKGEHAARNEKSADLQDLRALLGKDGEDFVDPVKAPQDHEDEHLHEQPVRVEKRPPPTSGGGRGGSGIASTRRSSCTRSRSGSTIDVPPWECDSTPHNPGGTPRGVNDFRAASYL